MLKRAVLIFLLALIAVVMAQFARNSSRLIIELSGASHEQYKEVPMSMTERYRRWWEYEKESHAKVLASLESLSDAMQGEPSFEKALELAGHIVRARRLWLFRLGATEESPGELFPQGVTLADLRARLEETQATWSGYLAGLTEAELARTLQYRSFDGNWYRNTVEDILTQLFGHSLYHRGQIAALVRSMGGEPAATDFVFWAREAIAPPVA